MFYLDILAAKAWLETWTGQLAETTECELAIFERIGASGRRALLAAQGFLAATPARKPKDAREEVAGAY
jgi:hypothetical protein